MLDIITNGTYVLIPVEIIPRFIWFFFMVGIGSRLGRLARDNRGTWERAREPVSRSFESSTAPLVVAQRGCRGLFLSWVYGPLSLVFYLIAIVSLVDWMSSEVNIGRQLITELTKLFI